MIMMCWTENILKKITVVVDFSIYFKAAESSSSQLHPQQDNCQSRANIVKRKIVALELLVACLLLAIVEKMGFYLVLKSLKWDIRKIKTSLIYLLKLLWHLTFWESSIKVLEMPCWCLFVEPISCLHQIISLHQTPTIFKRMMLVSQMSHLISWYQNGFRKRQT